MKRYYEGKVVTVEPRDGSPIYQTYLLSQILDDTNGRLLVSHVSGPIAIFPEDARIVDDELIAEAE